MSSLVMGLVILGMTCVVNAAPVSVINGGFETGDFTGWSSISYGGQAVVMGDSGFLATEGQYFANLYADSLMSQATSWQAGDTLSFDWNFNANDYMPFNDFSIFKIVTGSSTLFDLTLANVASVGDFNATGWNTYTYTFATAGTGSFAFGVYNNLDWIVPSQLYIDNVNTAPVPEPATLFLFGSGLVGLVIKKRKK